MLNWIVTKMCLVLGSRQFKNVSVSLTFPLLTDFFVSKYIYLEPEFPLDTIQPSFSYKITLFTITCLPFFVISSLPLSSLVREKENSRFQACDWSSSTDLVLSLVSWTIMNFCFSLRIGQ